MTRAATLTLASTAVACLLFPAVASTSRVTSASANLIRNGSLESPVVAAAGCQLFAVGQSFPGWQVVGTAGANVAPISGSFTQNSYSFPAKVGKQWIDVSGTSDVIGKAGAGLAQTVKTVPGKRYLLRFSVGNVIDPGIFGTSSTVNVSVNGHRLLSARNNGGAAVMTQVWKDFAVNFKATTTTSKILFLNADVVRDTNNGLDAVSLTRLS